jgi:hypothetical protein
MAFITDPNPEMPQPDEDKELLLSVALTAIRFNEKLIKRNRELEAENAQLVQKLGKKPRK